MKRKCCTCLCQTCLNTCCDRKNCIGKKEFCEGYSGFRQLSILDPQPQYQSAPRHSRKYYGISKGRYRQLKEYIRSGRYASLASSAAHTANKDIAEYILLSVKENLSYEGLQRLWDLKKIERMACGRSDFYGYQSLFYHLFDLEVKKEECMKN